MQTFKSENLRGRDHCKLSGSGLDSAGSGSGPVEGSCEHGNEPASVMSLVCIVCTFASVMSLVCIVCTFVFLFPSKLVTYAKRTVWSRLQ
jgi:hypothetical protein